MTTPMLSLLVVGLLAFTYHEELAAFLHRGWRHFKKRFKR
jgi:hypothetical protein